MNPILQCFCNIPKLRTSLLNKDLYQDLEKNGNSKKLTFALAKMLIFNKE